jgi:hypothetical protein
LRRPGRRTGLLDGRVCLVGFLVACAALASSVLSPGAAAANKKPSSQAALEAIARAINVKASDLPGWTVVPNTAPEPGPSYKTEFLKCVGKKGAKKLAQASSPQFAQGGLQASSNVNIVANDADALADLTAIKSPKLPGCFARYFSLYAKKDLLTHDHATMGKVSASFFNPGNAIPNAVGFQISTTVTATVDGITSGEGIYFSTVEFVVGRSEIEFSLGELGQRITVPIEPTLLNTLCQRAMEVAAL